MFTPQPTAQSTENVQESTRDTPGSVVSHIAAPRSASEVYAALTRDQWANYINTFVPLENKLIQYATDKTLPGQKMAEASQNVQSAFTQQQGATERRLSGLGVSLSGDEQAAQTRAYGLSKSLADVGAQNMAREATVNRQQSLLGNPAPDVTMGARQSGV